MTEKQAMREAKKRWGKKAYIESRLGASDTHARERAHAELKIARDHREAIGMEVIRRLRATPWWLEMEEQQKKLTDEIKTLQSKAMSYRFQVGALGLMGMAFCVRGQGDTWEEAFARASRPIGG